MEVIERRRRHFLQLLSAGAASNVVVSACSGSAGTSEATEAQGPVAAGNVESVPLGTLRFVENAPLILGRDEGGLYALSALCTHSRCNIASRGTLQDGVITCECHGARFDKQGTVLRGPAVRPLTQLHVDITSDGQVIIQTDIQVLVGMRTPVPG